MGSVKSSSKREFTTIQAYLRKHENSQMNNLILHLNGLGKEQTKSKVNRRKEIIKIRAEINEIETNFFFKKD